MRGRRLARHPHRAGAADGRRAVRARHRARGHDRDARAVRRGAARRRTRCRACARSPTSWRRRPPPSCATQGVPADRIRVTRRAHLRYDGTDTDGPGRARPTLAAMTAEFEAALPADVLVPHGPPADRRGDVGRGHRAAPSSRTSPHAGDRGRAGRAGQRCRCTPADAWRDAPLYRARAAAPRRVGHRPGDHRGGQRDHGRRAGLACRAVPRPATCWCSRERARRRTSPMWTPSARTRCCWRSSTTCSCRSPSRWAPRSSRPRSR